MSRCVIAVLGAAIAASCAVVSAGPAAAADGEVLITQARALAGGVAPGDTPGFPVTISLAGSYKLASNLLVTTRKNGIEVIAADVTIDLNGFRIHGGSVAYSGITGNQRSLTVRNGSITKFLLTGVYCNARYMIVNNMRITENSAGIQTDSEAYHIESSIVSYNEGSGIIVNGHGTVLGNTITSNGGVGLNVYGAGPVGVGNNTIVNNRSRPIFGPVIKLHPNACAPQACP